MSEYNHPAIKTTAQLLARYGNPVTGQAAFEHKWMVVYTLPLFLRQSIPCFPARMYLNRDIVSKFATTMETLIEADLHREIKTWDGCFNVRRQRGSKTISRHSWGIAVDMNAAWNKLYGQVSWSRNFLNVWREAGWICGADFHSRKDGMHFERTAANSW